MADLVATYVLSFRQREAEAPLAAQMVRGEAIGSLGMTEPHAGSDLKAIRTRAKAERDGDRYSGDRRAEGVHFERPAVRRAWCWRPRRMPRRWRQGRDRCSSSRRRPPGLPAAAATSPSWG